MPMALLTQGEEPVVAIMRAMVAAAGALVPAGLLAHAQSVRRTALAGALGAMGAVGLFEAWF